MRPSELLRSLYKFDRINSCEIYPCELEPYTSEDGRRMFRGVVTCNVNAVIAKACYMERIAHNARYEPYDREEYRRNPLYRGNVMLYIPHDTLPIDWAIEGGI